MWTCPKRFSPELYYLTITPRSLNVRMLKAEVMETLLYRCVTWTLSAKHSTKLRTAHPQVLLRAISLQRRQRTDHTTLSRKPSSRHDARSSKRISTYGGFYLQGPCRGKTRGDRTQPGGVCDYDRWGKKARGHAGGQRKTWHKCLVGDITVVRTPEGFAEHPPLMVGVETTL